MPSPEVSTQAAFHALAASLVALVLATVLPAMWRETKSGAGSAANRRRAWATTAAMVLGLPMLTFGLYGWRGEPDALDALREELSAEFQTRGLPATSAASQRLHDELARHLERRPADVRARIMQARLELREGRHERAAAAFRQALAGRSKAALDAGVWVEYAEARALAQGGTLVGEPRRLVQRALEIDGHHAQALDLAGSAAWEARDYGEAAMHWRQLLMQVPATDPRHEALRHAIARAHALAPTALPSLRAPAAPPQAPG